MITSLTTAIRNKLVVRLDYPPGVRFIEPHALGYGKDGHILLRAYQVSGASASGESPNWKLFRVDKCLLIELTDALFPTARPLYNAADKAMKGGIIACL
jgi:hypothetical protein